MFGLYSSFNQTIYSFICISGEETEWKTFANDQVGLSANDIKYFDNREKNPAMAILNEYCDDWTVDRLYNALVDSGARATADRYL